MNFVFCALLISLAIIDAKTWTMPIWLMLMGTLLGIAYSTTHGDFMFTGWRIFDVFLAFGVFWLLEIGGNYYFKREALGGGDKYMIAMITAFMGAKPLIVITLLSSLQGAAVGIGLRMFRRKWLTDPDTNEETTAIPYGPFLALAAMEVLFLSPFLKRIFPAFLSFYL